MNLVGQSKFEGVLLVNAAGEMCVIVPKGAGRKIFRTGDHTFGWIKRSESGMLSVILTRCTIEVDGSRPELFSEPVNLLVCEMDEGDVSPEDAGIIRLSRLKPT